MLLIEVQNNGTHVKRPAMGNYTYRVLVNGQVIASGEVVNHDRSEGWRKLLELLINDDLTDEVEGPL
jgi:hypothetical protein